MKTFLKVLLYILIWALITGLVIGATLLLGESLTLGIRIAVALFAAWLLFLLVRRLIVRWRAKKRVQGLINEEAPDEDEASPGFWSRLLPQQSGFSGRFQKVINLLRDSRLRTQGEALYVLPWYLVMDPAGDRSNLLNHADLSTPTIHDPALTSDGTSFDWFLYNQAVCIEVPDSHIRAPGNREKGEWSHLLQGLLRYRRKEPLNGIVVQISVRHLLDTEPGILAEEGYELRGRIDEIMGGLKLRVPIYLMLSGIEELPELRDWATTLDADALNDAMGIAADEESKESGPVFIQCAVRKVADRLKDLALVRLADQSESASLVSLPALIESLAEPLASFAGRAFETNPYQESPMLRGVYFGGAIEHESDEPEAKNFFTGLFLREFFTDVLPADRKLVSTLTSAERAETFTRRVVFSGWTIAVILAFVGLIWAYLGNAAYLDQQARRYGGLFAEQPQFQSNLESLSSMREMVIATDEEISGWMVPWFNFASPPDFVLSMRKLYVERFRRRVLEPTDAAIANRIDAGSKQSDQGKNRGKPTDGYDSVSVTLWSLVNRINLLNAYLAGQSQEQLRAMPRSFDVLEQIHEGGLGDVLQERMHDSYIQYLVWQDDDERVKRELAASQTALLTVLRTQLTGLDWLIPWADQQLPGRGIRLSDYWLGTGSLPESVRINPAFTLEGKEAIDTFLERLSATDPDSEELAKMQRSFDKLYRSRYFEAWENFALNFNAGRSSLRGRSEYSDMIDLIASDRSPFLRLLNDASAQIKPFTEADGAELSQWATLVTYFQEVSLYSNDSGPDDGKRNKTLAKLVLKSAKVFGSAGKAIGAAGKKGMKTQKKLAGKGGPDLDAVLEQSAETYSEYRKALLDIAFNADIKSVSFKSASSLFADPDNPGAGDGPEARAWNAVRKLQTLIGKRNKANAAFWEIYAGPLEVITDYQVTEAACFLQERWKDGLLVELEGVPEYKKPELMFGPEGKVWGFINGDAGPFVKRAYGKGYVPVRALGRSLPLKSKFLNFVSRGRDGFQVRQDNYDVSFQAFPTTAEPLTGPQPSMTTLTLECPDALQELVNLNFAVGKTLNWTPACGDVRMEIEVNGLRYGKTWAGPKAFPRFLTDFRDGGHRFVPSDFGDSGKSLMDMGVQSIQVEYEIKGHKGVIGALKEVSTKAPALIAGCWERKQ